MMLKRVMLAVLMGVSLSAWGAGEETGKRTELFNGKDLSGWETWLAAPLATSTLAGAEKDEKGSYLKPLGLNNDPLGVFKVEMVDGRPAIHVSGEGYGTLTTLETFSNYHFKAQFKWGEKKFGAANRPRNGGLLYHAYGHHGEVGGRWMNAHQYQIEEGTCGDYIGVGATIADATMKTGDGKKRIYDPAGEIFAFRGNVKEAARCSRAGGEEVAPGGWNTLELYCVGDEIIHVINGRVTVRLTKSRKESGEALTSGHIALQIEAAEIYFRDLVMEPLAKLPEKI